MDPLDGTCGWHGVAEWAAWPGVIDLLRRVGLPESLQRGFGLTCLTVSHNLDVVRAMSDRVLVLYPGLAVEVGPAEHVLGAPAHPYTRALLAAVPRFDPGNRHRAPPLPGDVPSPRNPPSGCAFHPRCPLADARCRTEEPAERTLADGRRVACHKPLTPFDPSLIAA